MSNKREMTTEDLLEFEMLKRLHGITVNNMYSYIPYWREEIVREKLDLYLKNGLVEICSGYRVLPHMTIPFLKDILKSKGLKISGRKKELVDRITQNIKIEDLEIPREYEALIRRTEKGDEIYQHLLLSKEKEWIDLIDNIVGALKNRNFNEANRLMCIYEIKQPFQRGLFLSIGVEEHKSHRYGINTSYWASHLKYGFCKAELDAYVEALEAISWDVLGILHICLGNMLGLGYEKSKFEIERYFIRHNMELEPERVIEYNNFTSKVYVKRELIHLKDMGVNQYKILGCRKNECSKCIKLDGKCFNVEDAVEGVNLPPFCNSCGGTISGVF